MTIDNILNDFILISFEDNLDLEEGHGRPFIVSGGCGHYFAIVATAPREEHIQFLMKRDSRRTQKSLKRIKIPCQRDKRKDCGTEKRGERGGEEGEGNLRTEYLKY